jgi:3-deoxy-D-manno-octulosonic-acid transferase
MANFREIAALVLENKAGVQVNTPAELAGTLRRLIDDPAERQMIGDNGLEMMRLNGGSTGRHLEALAGQLAP